MDSDAIPIHPPYLLIGFSIMVLAPVKGAKDAVDFVPAEVPVALDFEVPVVALDPGELALEAADCEFLVPPESAATTPVEDSELALLYSNNEILQPKLF
jgi:hypothetical protein